MPHTSHRLLLTVWLLAACSGSGGQSAGRSITDTLPGGIISVTNPGPPHWSEGHGWRLVEAGRIGGVEEGPDALIEPRSIALDGEGRVFIADTRPLGIKVFDRTGHLVRTIGREGAGPGEFRGSFIAVHGPHLIVHDPRQSRTSVFDTAGTFLRSWISACCYWTDVPVDREGRIYISAASGGGDLTARYLRYTVDGKPVDTLDLPRSHSPPSWTVKRGNTAMMSTWVLFAPGTRWAVPPEGGIIHGWSGDYRLAESRTGRDTVRVFGRAWSPSPVGSGRARRELERMIKDGAGEWGEAPLREAFHFSDIPATLPAFDNIMIAPDGHRWLRIDTGDTTQTVFDVFTPADEFLGQVVAPLRFPPYRSVAWGQGELAIATETDAGLPVVIRYQIVKQP